MNDQSQGVIQTGREGGFARGSGHLPCVATIVGDGAISASASSPATARDWAGNDSGLGYMEEDMIREVQEFC